MFNFLLLFRVQACERDIKVNIFDMAGHPIFYEVTWRYMVSLVFESDNKFFQVKK